MAVSGSITIIIRLFALYRERLERDRLTLSVPRTATVATALEELALAHPRIGSLVQSTMVAVNEEYAEWNQPLQEGDEVALIPPVSGGQARRALRCKARPRPTATKTRNTARSR